MLNRTYNGQNQSRRTTVKACQGEDPWDVDGGGRGTTSHSLAAPPIGVIITLLALLFGLTLILTSSLKAQSVPPPIDEFETAKKSEKLEFTRETLEVAADYAELLEQLKFISADYASYFAEFEVYQAEAQRDELRKLAQLLRDTAYFADYIRLQKDMAKLQEQLVSSEKDYLQQVKSSKGKSESKDVTYEAVTPKLYSLTRSLRREVEMINDLLEEDVTRRLVNVTDAGTEAVRQYVKAITLSRVQGLSPETDIYLQMPPVAIETDEETGTITVTVLSPDEGSHPQHITIQIPEMPEMPEMPEVSSFPAPDLPDIPDVPDVPDLSEIYDRSFVYVKESGETVQAKELIDSIMVPSEDMTIYIANPVGTLVVEAWDGDYVQVRTRLEVAAETQSQAKAVIKKIELRLLEKKDAIYVKSFVPELSNPQTKIISSEMTIKSPENNPLVCSNSFGSVAIRGFSRSVKLSSNHSDVVIRDIEGEVDIVNSMGKVSAVRIEGTLNIRNAYQPLTVTSCEGNMRLENAFASIDLESSAGEAMIRNSGSVTVVEFDGPIDIENTQGSITVQDIDGDLVATTELSSITVANISGLVDISGLRSSISVREVDGPLTASNSFGYIKALRLTGPVNIVNLHGKTDLMLDEGYSGESILTSDFGEVVLTLGADTDLNLTVENVGGKISGSMPLNIIDEGTTQFGRLSMGNASNTLKVSANQSSVIVSESH